MIMTKLKLKDAVEIQTGIHQDRVGEIVYCIKNTNDEPKNYVVKIPELDDNEFIFGEDNLVKVKKSLLKSK